jgi:hypothetical protein
MEVLVDGIVRNVRRYLLAGHFALEYFLIYQIKHDTRL